MSEKTVGVFNKPSNKNLINDLKSKKYDIFLLPQIETTSNFDSFMFEPNNYDWLIFTDGYAVEYFVQMLETNSLDKFELDSLRICVFGEAVADNLRLHQIHADVIPPKIDENIIFKSICDYQLPNNLRFFITANQSQLSNLLKNKQAKVFESATYKTKVTEDALKLKILIKNGAIDEVIFTSPNEVTDWKVLISPDDFTSNFEDITPIAADAQTFQYLFEHGLKPLSLQKSHKIENIF
jgi:uroporphyrinogen-III synthase